MSINGLIYYNRQVGETFIKERISQSANYEDQSIIRSVRVLSEYLEKGSVSRTSVHRQVIELTGKIGLHAQSFIEKLKRERRSNHTLVIHRRNLHYFITHLNRIGIESISDIKEEHILQFVSSLINNRACIVSSLRLFLRFSFMEKSTHCDLSYILSEFKFEKREKLPSYYRKEEVIHVENSVSRTSGVGKRDYAVLLLASRLGLRASDIAHLEFSNLDWDQNVIRLQQYKTGRTIELPLLVEVGESIISYLKYGRQQSKTLNVFLSAQAPYRPMSSKAVSSAIQRIFEKSGVNVMRRKHSAHSMRHSLAVRLLEEGTPLPVISESLGHTNSSSTGVYLKVDVSGLRKCALNVPLVQTGFYDQKGGIFYE
jgi:site-specific recombinase XerD